MATNFGTKIDYSLALVKDDCFQFAPTAPLFLGPHYPMVSFKFFPCCHGNKPFYSKTKLAAGSQEHQMLKRSC